MSLDKFAKETGKLIVFFGIQYALGRRGSFPYGLLVKYNLLKISVLVVISDMFQTLFLLYFFEYFIKRLKWVKKLKERLKKKEPGSQKNRLEKFKKIGGVGVLLISALPYAGGALSGSILATSMRMEKKKAFGIITMGCVIGTCIYYLGFTGIIEILNIK
ncbi:MAG: small multi-drug export protein [Candidatus Aminicenantia bacterium]